MVSPSRCAVVIALWLLITTLGMQWLEPRLTFLDALHWSLQSFTTVGYGDTVPTTSVGKLFACGASVLGIAIFSLITSVVANSFTTRTLMQFTGMLTGLSVTMLMWSESWALPDALYFVVMSLTTIGYGDIVVKTSTGRLVSAVLMASAVGPAAALMGVAQGIVSKMVRNEGGPSNRNEGDPHGPSVRSRRRKKVE